MSYNWLIAGVLEQPKLTPLYYWQTLSKRHTEIPTWHPSGIIDVIGEPKPFLNDFYIIKAHFHYKKLNGMALLDSNGNHIGAIHDNYLYIAPKFRNLKLAVEFVAEDIAAHLDIFIGREGIHHNQFNLSAEVVLEKVRLLMLERGAIIHEET